MASYWTGTGPPVPPRARGYDAAYQGVPNWDIGRPQRAFVELEAAGAIGRRVLDVGCGTGELSLYLARQGHEVLGIDFSPRAIQTAREKAHWRRVDAHFLVWDVLELDRLGVAFDTVVDSAMLHCLGDAERDRFVDGLATVLRPGGRYVVQVDARPDDSTVGDGGLSRREFRERFPEEEGWRIDWIAEAVFDRRYSRNVSYVASITRTG